MNLLDILYDFNEGINWRETRDRIQNAVIDYNDALTDVTNDNPGQSLNECLPEYWQIVRAHNTYRWGGENQLPSNSRYDIGIFLVGFSSLPIVLSIAEIQPCERIYFLHSPETGHKCDEITNRFEEMLDSPPLPLSPLIDATHAAALINRVRYAKRCKIADPSDPVETFKEIKEVIDNIRQTFGSDTKIALDLTGGKKTMIGGGFTAGSIYPLDPKCDMFYIDSSEYDPERGAPLPSTEFLNQLEAPYDVYNVQSVQQAEKLFEKHNYEAAALLWDDVLVKLESAATRYRLESELDAVQKNSYIADCYGLWDAFDYIEAKNSKDNCVREATDWGYVAQHIYGSIDVLEILSGVEDTETLFAQNARIIHYAVDRYQNGIRRMESDRFDDATVRFTQVVEILCRYKVYRIAENDQLTYYNGSGVVDPQCCLEERWRISDLIHFLFGQCLTYDEYYCIEIKNAGARLRISEYDYCDSQEITKLIQPRNNFVHVQRNPGWEEMRENAENLQCLSLKFLENFSRQYCDENGLSLEELLQLHKFRR